MVKKKESGIGLVVPSHNDSETIIRCLESVAKQSLLPDHIVIADDASTDATVKLVKEFQEDAPQLPLEIVVRPKNLGLARNVADAVKILGTRYFTKLDADDLYLNEKKLENERKLIAERGDQVVAYSLSPIINSADEIVSAPEMFQNSSSGEEILYRKTAHLPREFLVSMDAMHEVGGYPTRPRLYVDWWFKSALASLLPFESTGEVGSGYRKLPRSGSTRMSSRGRLIHAYWISQGFVENRGRFRKNLTGDDLLFFPRVWGGAGLKMVLDALRSMEP